MGYQTIVKKPILSGTTPRVRFQIVDEDGIGYVPDEVTMSIYDVTYPATVPCPIGSWSLPPSATESIINSRNDVDILTSVDGDGVVDVTLAADDTAVEVPSGAVPLTYQRRILFRWVWDTTKVGKHEVILTIAPDRETVAT